MKKPSAITVLAVLVAALAAVATAVGIASSGSGDPVAFTSARGDAVQLYGHGLYQYDSLFSGANYRAQDIVTLVLGVPLLVIATVGHIRGSRRSRLVLAGMFGFFLYAYASMALSAVLNPMFLVYVATMSCSLFGVVLTVRACAEDEMPDEMPYRFGEVLLLVCGVVTLLVWMLPLLTAQLGGATPSHLDHYTTLVTYALDIGIIAPLALVAGMMLRDRRPFGFALAMPLLGTIIMLLPLIVGGTISQSAAGIEYTPGEVIGPISGFAALGIAALLLVRAILRPIGPTDHQQVPS